MKVVAISDTHGSLPSIPACDLLIHAGDICPDVFRGLAARMDSRPQREWFNDVWVPWRQSQPATTCFLTWGNHDYCGEKINQDQLSVRVNDRTLAIIDETVYWLAGGKKLYLTPWSSTFRDWAFMQEEDRLKDIYALIPEGLDILVTHQPPYGICDANGAFIVGSGTTEPMHLGSAALLNAIERSRPKIVICGHIHGGHGHGVLWPDSKNPVRVYNVAMLDEQYQPVWSPTEIPDV